MMDEVSLKNFRYQKFDAIAGLGLLTYAREDGPGGGTDKSWLTNYAEVRDLPEMAGVCLSQEDGDWGRLDVGGGIAGLECAPRARARARPPAPPHRPATSATPRPRVPAPTRRRSPAPPTRRPADRRPRAAQVRRAPGDRRAHVDAAADWRRVGLVAAGGGQQSRSIARRD
jgi:hypothetical protein